MNFYTFNSNHILRNFFFLVLTVFITYNVVLDVALQYYVDRKTNKFSFIEEKVSKAKHMKLQDNADYLDYIFIGSSRTIYHVSTEQFKESGIQIYNFGTSNRALADYPYMINEAISMKPEYIVINLTIKALFQGGMGHYDKLTLEDLKYIFEFQDISEFGKALQKYIQSKHLLFKHSEPMHIRLSQIYKSFDPKTVNSGSEDTTHLSKHNKKPKADCKIFDYNYPSDVKITAKCTNGDGVLFGNTLNDVNRTKHFDTLHKNYTKILNTLLDTVKENGIKPIVVLEPVFKQKYDYDISMIRKNINAEVIDLTKVHIADKNWADDKHFNVKGRAIYTNELIERLSDYSVITPPITDRSIF